MPVNLLIKQNYGENVTEKYTFRTALHNSKTKKNDIIKHFVFVFSKLQTRKSKLFTISVSDLLEINYSHEIEFLMFSGGRERVHWEQMG